MESLSRISRCGRVDRWIQEALHGNQTLHPFVSCLFGNFRSKHARSGQQCLKSNLVETQSGLFFAPFLLTTCAEAPARCKFLTLHGLLAAGFEPIAAFYGVSFNERLGSPNQSAGITTLQNPQTCEKLARDDPWLIGSGHLLLSRVETL